MANSFLYRMPSGIAGNITRIDETNVETAYMGATAVGAFGAPVKIVNGLILPFAGGETATSFYGVLTRVAPSQGGSLAQSFTDNVPNPLSLQGVAVRGYVNVVCTIGTPVKEGAVYVRVVAASGKAIGDFEATADGVNNVLLTNAVWAAGGKDANNNAEIRIAR